MPSAKVSDVSALQHLFTISPTIVTSLTAGWAELSSLLSPYRAVVPVTPYLFFYAFRLLMTIVVLPLLMGFVIRSFNGTLFLSSSCVLLQRSPLGMDIHIYLCFFFFVCLCVCRCCFAQSSRTSESWTSLQARLSRYVDMYYEPSMHPLCMNHSCV
jgi:hypothetical protein